MLEIERKLSRFLAIIIVLISGESFAQSNILDVESNRISIRANTGIDWNKAKHNFVARGQALITITDEDDREIKLRAETIRLDYEAKDTKNIKLITSKGRSSFQIDNILIMSEEMVFDLVGKKLIASVEPNSDKNDMNNLMETNPKDQYDPKYSKIVLDFENDLDTIEITAIKIELTLSNDESNEFKDMTLTKDVRLTNKDFTLSGELGRVSKLAYDRVIDDQNKHDYIFSICEQVYLNLEELDISTNCAIYNSADKQISLRGRSNISNK